MALATFSNKLKGIVILVALVLIVCVSIGAVVKNKSGFSGRWNIYLEEIIRNQGINAKVGGFRYSFNHGLVTNNFEVFSHEDPKKLCATFEKVFLDFDDTQIANGQFAPEKLILKNGKAWVDLNDEDQDRIFLEDINCVIDLKRGYDVIIQECSAKVNGMKVTLIGESVGILQPKETKSKIEIPEVLRGIFRHINQASYAKATPPEINVILLHKFGLENGLEIDIDVVSEGVTYKGIELEKLISTLRYENKTLKVKDFYVQDDTGELTAEGHYYVPTKEAQFNLDSSTNFPKILRGFGVSSIADKLVSPLPPLINAKVTLKGEGEPDEEIKWNLETYGHLKLDEFRLLGTTFQSLDTEFSWRDGKLFLRDMDVSHKEGYVSGKILVMDQYIRYEADSNLPIYLYKPFIKKGGILETNINKTDFREDSAIKISMKGSMQRDQIDQWEASGNVSLTNIDYNNVPLNEAACSFIFTPVISEFDDIEAVFNYAKYVPSQFAEKQPSRGVVIAEKISFDSVQKAVTIRQLGGRAWPAQVINLFVPKVGEFLDETVFFTEPPAFSTNGVIGISGNTEKTNLQNKILIPTDVYYNFLGQDLRFEKFNAQISLANHSVILNNITTKTLSGELSGNMEVLNKNSNNPEGGYSGDIAFSNVSLSDVADQYDFTTKTPGNLTGRIDFSGSPESIRSLNGSGFIGLDQADLFYIPIFGPLSPIMSGLMGHKKSSHEKVRSVSASFTIKNGNVLTDNLASETPSAQIIGHGKIDLETKEIDLTAKTKTQGLLGLITLPIKPLEKLLQFRGTGTIAEPTWAYSPLESTPKYLNEDKEMNRAIIAE